MSMGSSRGAGQGKLMGMALLLACAPAGCGRDASAAPGPDVRPSIPDAAPTIARHDARPLPIAADPSSRLSADRDREPPPGSRSAPLAVRRLVVTTGIEQREPLPVTELRADAPVVAFLEVSSEIEQDTGVLVSFVPEVGPPVGLVHLDVPAKRKRWRTWARTNRIQTAGSWEAVVTNDRAEVLARAPFQVTEQNDVPVSVAEGEQE